MSVIYPALRKHMLTGVRFNFQTGDIWVMLLMGENTVYDDPNLWYLEEVAYLDEFDGENYQRANLHMANDGLLEAGFYNMKGGSGIVSGILLYREVNPERNELLFYYDDPEIFPRRTMYSVNLVFRWPVDKLVEVSYGP